MSVESIKKEVCQAGKNLLKKGLVARTWGNVSIRLNENEMVITPSGLKYDDLFEDDMVLVNFRTLKYEGKHKPSSELKLHAEIYKSRPEINAVIHTHQMMASIFSSARKDIDVPSEFQSIMGCDKVKAAPYALPNTKKITFATLKALGNSNAALMSNHGTVCVGTDMPKAFEVAINLEEISKINLEKSL